MVFESFGKLICGRSSVVERNLAKVDVEGSSPFARFSNSNPKHHASGFLLNSYCINPLSQTLLHDSTVLFRCCLHCSNLFAYPAAGKFSRASSAGGRRNLRSNFVNRILSVAEDCLSPERTFHGCTLMQFRCSIPWLFQRLIALLKSSNSFPCRLRKVNKERIFKRNLL